MTSLLEEICSNIAELTDGKRKPLHADVDKVRDMLWVPNPGSQTLAFESEADEIGYGGEAGPGKTDLLIGLSLTSHRNALVLRRTNKEAKKLAERYEGIVGHRDGLNTSEGIWRLGNRLIEYGGIQDEEDKQKYKGTPRDLIAWDEVVDFTLSQYTFVNQWNRTTDPDQRCRIVATFNPPSRPVGLWVIDRWGPWLDPKHPNPAKSGEIRWFTTVNGMDTEVEGRGPHFIDGEDIFAKSRTFIRGHLDENPDLTRTNYDSTRAAAPTALRDLYRAGNFEAALADVPMQLIPTSWVRAAQARWTPDPPVDVPMCAMGVDCTGGGEDPLVIARRYDGWFDHNIRVPGSEIPQNRIGAVTVGHIIGHRHDEALLVIDVGGGYGGPVVEKCEENSLEYKAYKGAAKSMRRTRDRKMKFKNVRTQAYWGFREALDPEQVGGSLIALPPNPLLVSDLTSPTFFPGPNGIELEKKEDVVARLGRSTDDGDAVIMAWWGGATHITHGEVWRDVAKSHRRPRVVRGHEKQRR